MKYGFDSKTIKKLILLVGAAAFNFSIYYLGRSVARTFQHHELYTAVDGMIPFLPWMIVIYWGAYALWIANYFLSSFHDKSGYDRTLLAHYMGEIVCLLCFIFFPTTMVRPEVWGTGIFESLTRLTYRVDSADNLLPSIHCFVSWISWIGVRNNPDISKAYKWFSFVFATAICISTLTVKQHVIIDVFTGIGLAELSYFAAGRMKCLFVGKKN